VRHSAHAATLLTVLLRTHAHLPEAFLIGNKLLHRPPAHRQSCIVILEACLNVLSRCATQRSRPHDDDNDVMPYMVAQCSLTSQAHLVLHLGWKCMQLQQHDVYLNPKPQWP
jgi:hypothetical protein